MPTTNPRLHPSARLLTGMDDAPLLLHTETGRYHRLSRSAAATLRLFDGERSTDEVATAVARARGQQPAAVHAELSAFLDTLGRAGLLDGTEARPGPAARRSRVFPRFVLTRGLPRRLEPVAAWLRRGQRAAIWMTLLVVAGLGGAAVGVVALATAAVRGSALGGGPAAFGAAVALLLAQIAIHECAHALACQVLGTPVRSAGVALLFWLVPVAYVDRTDAYQIRGRGGRVALAVAGPLLDGVAMGVTAAVALAWPSPVAAHLLVFQLFTLILNVNPLLPSDGYVAIEAATGLVDPRGRAYALLRHRLGRRGTGRRPLPAHLAAMSRPARLAHLGYGVLCALYVLLIGWAMITGLLVLARHLVAALA